MEKGDSIFESPFFLSVSNLAGLHLFSKITQARIRSCANFSIILNEVIEK